MISAMWTERFSPVFMHTPGVRDNCWGVMWRSRNLLDGITLRLMCGPETCAPALFRTRRAAQEWIDREYGYIRTRPDLRAEPHGWRMPIPVRVTVTVNQKLST